MVTECLCWKFGSSRAPQQFRANCFTQGFKWRALSQAFLYFNPLISPQKKGFGQLFAVLRQITREIKFEQFESLFSHHTLRTIEFLPDR